MSVISRRQSFCLRLRLFSLHTGCVTSGKDPSAHCPCGPPPPSRPPCHVWSPAPPSWISPLRLYWLCITPGYLLPRAKASLTCCLHCCGMLPPPPLLSFSDSSWGYTHTWLFRRTTCRTITDFSSPVSSLQSSPCPQAPNRIQFPLMSPSSTLYKKAGDQPSTT